MKLKFNDRKLKYGSVSLAITLLVLAAIIIINTAFTALAYRFSFYTDMTRDATYEITDNCINYIETTVMPKLSENESVTIMFCNDENVIASDADMSSILKSAREIEKAFSDKIKVGFLNVWENPKEARKYGITGSTDVAIICDERFQVIAKNDFFLFDSATETAVAYNGEKRFAAALLKVAREDNPMCYITVNHGELIESYELLYMLADAGYNYNYLDLINYDIPEDCDLLLTFDPRQDLAKKDSVSGISEIEKIENYMANGGNFWFFASADTYLAGSLPGFEGILAQYGVKFSHKENDDGIEECLQIKDPANSTSVDGYTIFAENAKNNVADKIFENIKVKSILGNATAIEVADGFAAASDGSYTSQNGKITMSPLLLAHNGAQGWTDGKIVKKSTADSPFTLMSLSFAECENGERASLLACASTEFASEEAMQSTVYGNTLLLSSVSKHSGNYDAPTSLLAKPFPTTDMKLMTTKNATIITVLMSAVPTLAVVITGAIILIKRKNRA